MERVLLDRVISTDYGQFDLIWTDDGGFDGDDERFFADQCNGLVGAGDPKGVYVNLARRSGARRSVSCCWMHPQVRRTSLGRTLSRSP